MNILFNEKYLPLNIRYIHHSWVLILTLFRGFPEKLPVYPEPSHQRSAALAGDTLQCLHTHGERFYYRSNPRGTIGVLVYCAVLLHSSQDVMMLSVPSAPMPWCGCCVYCVCLATSATALCMHSQPCSDCTFSTLSHQVLLRRSITTVTREGPH